MFHKSLPKLLTFLPRWLPVIIDYQLEEVYLNQSLLFTAFYDSLLKVKIYKQGADSAGMKLIKLQQTCSPSSTSLLIVKLVVGAFNVTVELTDIWRPSMLFEVLGKAFVDVDYIWQLLKSEDLRQCLWLSFSWQITE